MMAKLLTSSGDFGEKTKLPFWLSFTDKRRMSGKTGVKLRPVDFANSSIDCCVNSGGRLRRRRWAAECSNSAAREGGRDVIGEIRPVRSVRRGMRNIGPNSSLSEIG